MDFCLFLLVLVTMIKTYLYMLYLMTEIKVKLIKLKDSKLPPHK